MAKEGKNQFELKKGKRFHFDLSKNPKRTFDLTKDAEEVITEKATLVTPTDTKTIEKASIVESKPTIASAVKSTSEKKTLTKKNETVKPQNPVGKPSTVKAATIPEPVEPEQSEGNRGNNKWIWIVGIILVLAVIAWLCVRGCSSSDKEIQNEPTVEGVAPAESGSEYADEVVDVTEETVDEPTSSESENVDAANSVSSSSETSTTSEAPLAKPTTTTASSEATTSSASASTSSTSNRVASNVPTAPATSVNVSSDIETEAMKVIRGEYGTGIERKLKLGSKYREIQDRVNELKRQGAF